jgi:hypothetical protein
VTLPDAEPDDLSRTVSADREFVPCLREAAWGADAYGHANPLSALDIARLKIGAVSAVAHAQSVRETVLAGADSSVAHCAHVGTTNTGSVNGCA